MDINDYYIFLIKLNINSAVLIFKHLSLVNIIFASGDSSSEKLNLLFFYYLT